MRNLLFSFDISALTLFTLVADVALERVKLQLESFELSLGARALALVDDQDDQDDSQHRAAGHRHADDPVVAAHWLQLLILQLTEHVDQVADANLPQVGGKTCLESDRWSVALFPVVRPIH